MPYETKREVLEKGKELADAHITFGELDVHDRLAQRGKGDLGQIVEEGWFDYTPNSEAEPDFAEAGVELKVSPYYLTRNGYSAQQRLVCNILNYMEEHDKSFEDSSFWHKCKCILLLSYEWFRERSKADLFVDHATLIDGYPEEDLLIMKDDYSTITSYIRQGKAEELSEGLTKYLGVCTKGANRATVRKQPYSDIPAMQRAYCLKTTYMTRLLRQYVFGEEESEHFITDINDLRERTFEEIIVDRISPYFGKTSEELMLEFGLDSHAKNKNDLLLRKLFGVRCNISNTEEFQRAGIIVKTIHTKKNGMPKEDTPFPAFRFSEIIQETWEESEFRNFIEAARFMFVVFRDTADKDNVLSGVRFHNVSIYDIEKIRIVWEDTVDKIRNDGVNLRYDEESDTVYNDFIGQYDSEHYMLENEDGQTVETNMVCHVRPHSRLSAYKLHCGYERRVDKLASFADLLPNGEWMSKQSFWFNKSYVKSVIE